MNLQNNAQNEILSNFFTFINFDLETVNHETLSIIAMAYVKFAYYDDSASSRDKYNYLNSPAFDSSPELFKDIKEFFENLQTHFRRLLDRIISSSEEGFALEQKGTRLLSIADGKIIQSFKTVYPPKEGLKFDVEKKYAEATLFDIIMNENLSLKMFNRCDNCQTFFYQKTKRETKFCSTKCSNAYRQRTYQATSRKKTSSKVPR